MIAILDYGAGNLRSVQNTLDEIGAGYQLVNTPEGLRKASKIFLPGVGHFGQMMRALDRLDVRAALVERIRAGIPFLGICLGLQALFDRSAEAADELGLSIFSGNVERFPVDARVPHMGWNTLTPRKPARLLTGLGAEPYVYFAHSYYVPGVRANGSSLHLHSPVHGNARGRECLRSTVSSGEVRSYWSADRSQLRGAVLRCWRSASSPAST